MNLAIYFSLMLLEILILLGVSIYGIGLLFSAFKGAPYVPTSKKQLDRILENASLEKNAQFVELGSGDGRLIRYAVKNYGVTGTGVEINPLLVWWSRYLSKRDGIAHKVSFIRGNVFNYPLQKVDYVYLFLMPELIKKLIPKFKKELKKEAIIISHGFKLPGFERKLIHTEFDKAFSTYYYKV
ncbi:hypothetical protein COS52_03460 [Candidatus Roizmanbacteria bacterium CG03_land_8_20_14_0_80_39_12]|uniref:DOT1 domain-containing protein n=1 Tax=Candidatus Roizmanbacteria bacterium CG03_land_8_20_14_0_80_39_12 TaxID=1974847 RepID=A0A2M7BS42_9BACT|nr:MAG: hypothetical protein COS52_03460 [Candidatus Roizmanbacteria bacterium CG03_land_8_20_14_0_80_39_12]